MRAKISVRVSKFVLTLLRNMRRRRKTRSIPSPFPVLLLFGLIILLRYLNVSSLSDTLRNASQQAVADIATTDDTTADDTTAVHQVPVPNEEAVQKGVTEEKRRDTTERRHAERRAMHRRIEQQRGAHETEHTESHQSSRDDAPGSASTGSATGNHSERGETHTREDTTPRHEQQSSSSHVGNAAVKSEPSTEDSQNTGTTKSDAGHTTEVGVKRSQKEATKGIPAGARVHGKQPEFGGSLGGSTDGMVRGQNVTRVSYTLFKIMKLFGFASLVDSLAGSHVEWMAEVVERMSFDHPSFQYTAVDDAEGIEKTKRSIGDVVDGEYLVCDVEERTANGSDVVFHWTELDGGARDARGKGYMEHIRKVMIAAKKGQNGYIVFGQFPRLHGPQPTYRQGKWVFVGEKEEPFLFNEHVRGVVPMGNGRESYMMYMTFYSLRSITMTELQA